MKYFIIFTLILVSCFSNKPQCPVELVEKNLCEEYNIAKWELYKLYLNCIVNDDSLQRKLFAKDLKFTGIENFDSITMFYYESEHLLDLSYNHECMFYNGIGFKNGRIEYHSQGDFAVLQYSLFGNQRMDSIMNATVRKNKKQLNPWMFEQGKQKKIF